MQPLCTSWQRALVIYLQKQVTVSSTSSGSDSCVAVAPLRCCGTARPGTCWRDVEEDACRNEEPGNVAVDTFTLAAPEEDGVCGSESAASDAKGTAE